MASELEIITPHLRGNCLTVDRKLHGLFKIRRQSPNAADRAWQLVRHDIDGRPAAMPPKPAGT